MSCIDWAEPSGIFIIADENGNPVFFAANPLAQAEHDENTQTTAMINSNVLAKAVNFE